MGLAHHLTFQSKFYMCETITYIQGTKLICLVLQICLSMSKHGIYSENLQLMEPESDLSRLLNY